MISFTATILKFDQKGEKTGWSYIDIPADLAQKLKKGNRKSFRVMGKLDEVSIRGVALMPMGDGSFILPVNSELRKKLGKKQGAMLNVKISEDKSPVEFDHDLMESIEFDEKAKKFFMSLSMAHKNYFSKWIAGAKTSATKTKRIAHVINSLALGRDFGAMLRSLKEKRDVLS